MTTRIETHEDLLKFYRAQTETSDPGPYGSAFEGLPQEIPALCRLLQNNMIHMWWIGKQAYGFTRQDLAGDGRATHGGVWWETAATTRSSSSRSSGIEESRPGREREQRATSSPTAADSRTTGSASSGARSPAAGSRRTRKSMTSCERRWG